MGRPCLFSTERTDVERTDATRQIRALSAAKAGVFGVGRALSRLTYVPTWPVGIGSDRAPITKSVRLN